MRCVIPQIRWNSCQQILSVDFDPSCRGEDGYYRLVTVGADTNLLVWRLTGETSKSPNLKCVAELNRHQKAVNVIRFSPDGNWIASGDDDAYIIIWKNESKTDEEEIWTVEKSLRKHVGDVTDLSWSNDSNYLLSSSVDSSAVLWDVKKGTSKYLWTEHSGYVHGVSFDPCGDLAATLAIDRTLRIFETSNGKVKLKVNRYSGWAEEKEDTEVESLPPVAPPAENETGMAVIEAEVVKKKSAPVGSHMFHDDGLATFCRRLAFSPRGEFLLVPSGICPSTDKPAEESILTGSPSEKERNAQKSKVAARTPEPKNAVIMFCRNDFGTPCAIIPTGSSYSLACRFCPVYFKHGSKAGPYGEEMSNPVKKDERRIYCTGMIQHGEEEDDDVTLNEPFRLIYAVATNDSVIIGATDKSTPLAIVRNIHFARLTDISWSSDGKILMVSSTDGYCSIITFQENELGEVLSDPPVLTSFDYPVPLKEIKTKAAKTKTPAPKKEKTTPAARKKAPDGSPSTVQPAGTANGPPPKKIRKIKPTKLNMEEAAESDNKQKEKDVVFLKPDGKPMPIPFVQLPRLSEKDFPPPLQNTEETDEDLEKSPAPVKLIPQKNTLDKWVFKKTKEEVAEAASSVKPPKSPTKKKQDVLAISDAPNKEHSADKDSSRRSTSEDDVMIVDEVKAIPTPKSTQKTPRRVQLITLTKNTKASEKAE